MTGETSGMSLLGGGIFLALGIYALVSAYVTGPAVGQRMATKLDWPNQCSAQIKQAARESQSPGTGLPKLGCMELFGWAYGREGQEYCSRYRAEWENNPFNKIIGLAEDKARQANEWRMRNAASKANTRCSCSLSLAIERNRTSLAIHSGALRFITPAPVRNWRGELITALNSPRCALKGAG